MKRWSNLQSDLYKIISPDIKFQIHCSAYPMRSQYGNTDIPRYWITIGKDIIWDYPKDFIKDGLVNEGYPYITDVSNISVLIKEYIDSSKEGLMEKQFEIDKWGLTQILKVSDRRIGKRQLKELNLDNLTLTIQNIIKLRLKITDEKLNAV